MEPLRLSRTESDEVRDIDTLKYCIIDTLGGDMTMLPQIHAFACYAVVVKRLPVTECVKQMRSADGLGADRVRRAIARLLSCQSAFMDLEPRALGVDLVSYTTAAKMQQSLDVKHYRKTNMYECFGRKIPNIKPNHLFSDKEYVWVRWYSRHAEQSQCSRPQFIVQYFKYSNLLNVMDHPTVEAYKIVAVRKDSLDAINMECKHFYGSDVEKDCDSFYDSSNAHTYKNDGFGKFECTKNRASMDNLRFQKSNDIVFIVIAYYKLTVFAIEPNLYESYVSKTKKELDTAKIGALIAVYDRDPDCSLVFLSELSYFRYSTLLFISNFVKFMYCYGNNRNVFDPTTFDDCRMVNVYLSNCCLFMSNTNLSSMSGDTHGPLVSYTGERPKNVMAKLAKSNKVYVNEGVRAMQSVNLSSDVGVRSNLIEVSGKLRSRISDPKTPYQYFDLSCII